MSIHNAGKTSLPEAYLTPLLSPLKTFLQSVRIAVNLWHKIMIMSLPTPEFNEIFLSTSYWLCYYSCPNFSLFAPSSLVIPTPTISSRSWVMQISSFDYLFPILFLTSPCLFCTYQLCFLVPAPFPPFSSFHLPADNPQNDLHIYDSVPVLVFP